LKDVMAEKDGAIKELKSTVEVWCCSCRFWSWKFKRWSSWSKSKI